MQAETHNILSKIDTKLAEIIKIMSKTLLTGFPISGKIWLSKGGEIVSFTIRQARVHREITQEEMAAALGVSVGAYRGYEQNPKAMPFGVLDRFTKIVQIPIDQITPTIRDEEDDK